MFCCKYLNCLKENAATYTCVMQGIYRVNVEHQWIIPVNDGCIATCTSTVKEL